MKLKKEAAEAKLKYRNFRYKESKLYECDAGDYTVLLELKENGGKGDTQFQKFLDGIEMSGKLIKTV